MERDFGLSLKEKHIYKAVFDSVSQSSNNPDDLYFDEVIYYNGGDTEGFDPSEMVLIYDGGGVEGYGN